MKQKNTILVTSVLKAILAFIFVIYLYVLLKIILFKYVSFADILRKDYPTLQSINLIPFHSILQYLNFGNFNINVISNLLGNIIIFVPIGIYLPLCFKKIRWYTCGIFSFCFSLLFEGIQYVLKIGSSDVDDVLLNLLGGLLGFLIFYLLKRIFKKQNLFLSSLIALFTLSGIFGFYIVVTHYGWLLPHIKNSAPIEVIYHNKELLEPDMKTADIDGILIESKEGHIIAQRVSKEWGLQEKIDLVTTKNTKVILCDFLTEETRNTYTYHNYSLEQLAAIPSDHGLKVWLKTDTKTPTADIILITVLSNPSY